MAFSHHGAAALHMQDDRALSMKWKKKWAVKLGDLTALGLPTEGGVFHRKVA